MADQARVEEDDLDTFIREQAAESPDFALHFQLAQARALVNAALFLRMNGERPPGAPRDDAEAETWRRWDTEAEYFLRAISGVAANSDSTSSLDRAIGPESHLPQGAE